MPKRLSLAMRTSGVLLLAIAGLGIIWLAASPSDASEATSGARPSTGVSGGLRSAGAASGRAASPASSGPARVGQPAPIPNDKSRARSESGDSVSISVQPQTDTADDGRPFRNPVDRWYVTSEMCPGHPTGIDIAISGHVTVRAAASGTVTFIGSVGNYGNLVMVQHAAGYLTSYGHLSRVEVKEGQRVAAGDALGTSGGATSDEDSGLSTGPHLHFEILHNGLPVQPIIRIPGPWDLAPKACYGPDQAAGR